jgi:ferredoxin
MIRLDRKRFEIFIEELAGDYTLYAPVMKSGKGAFGVVSSAGDIDSSRLNTERSPKEIFFPHSEVLFEYDEKGIRTVGGEDKPIAVWGMRGCDARSLPMLDKVFGSEGERPENVRFDDPYWSGRYDNSLIFSLACNEPLSTCFCNWFDSGPHDRKGADVFVVDTGDALLMEPVSEKGQDYLKRLKDTEQATKKDEKIASVLAAEAEGMLQERTDIDGLSEKLKKIFHKPVWDSVSAKCVNCGACSFTCSTCHCFDIQDEGRRGRGKRIRIWDTCMFPIFTKEASGHNPRALSKERVRQRVMHKYSYFVENHGEFLCTGCGRCVAVCPVNLDIREVIREVLAS